MSRKMKLSSRISERKAGKKPAQKWAIVAVRVPAELKTSTQRALKTLEVKWVDLVVDAMNEALSEAEHKRSRA